jgi:hypothetical protein
MKPHPRIRKTIKWGGAAVTVLLLMVWVAALFWPFGWGGPPGRAVSFSGGQLMWGKAYTFEGGRDWGIETTFPVPLWLPAVAMLPPTLIAWRLDATARRSPVNACRKCGYERTGLAGDVKCPECGAAPGSV